MPRGSFHNYFQGKKVLVVGSAPGDIQIDDETNVVLEVNGSVGRLFNQMQGAVRIGFVDEMIFSSNTNLHSNHLLRARERITRNLETLDLALLCSSNGYFAKTPLMPKGVRFERIGFSKMQRTLRSILGSKSIPLFPNGLPSSGVRAVVFALYAGAKEVRIDGFSLWKPKDSPETVHFYDDQDFMSSLDLREHAAADLHVLSGLFIRGFAVTSNVQELAPVFHQWNESADWSREGGSGKNMLAKLMFFGFLPDVFLRKMRP